MEGRSEISSSGGISNKVWKLANGMIHRKAFEGQIARRIDTTIEADYRNKEVHVLEALSGCNEEATSRQQDFQAIFPDRRRV